LPIATASFSPDGQALITGGFDGYLEEWDAATGERLRVLLDPCAQEDERPRVVCIEDGKEVEAPFQLVRLSESMRGSSILGVRFSPDGKIFVVGAANGDVVVWNSWSRGEMHAWRVHEHGVNALAVSPNGRWLAIGSMAEFSTSLHVWSLGSILGKGPAEYFTHDDHAGGVSSLCFSPDNRFLAAGGFQFTSYTGPILYSLETKQRISSFYFDMTRSLQYSPDGKFLATGDDFGTVSVWDIARREKTFSAKAHGRPIGTVQYSPDGRSVASCSWDGGVKVSDIAEGRELADFSYPGIIHACRFSPDGSELCIAEAAQGTTRPNVHRQPL
jgi:WD40 repeat protein